MPAASGGPLAALSNDLAAAVETVGRSVVAIHARRRIPASGSVWQPGLVVAAHHTIQRDEEIGVTLHDGSTVPATLAGRDPSTDLAVLRLPPEISATAAPPASFATEAPRVGQLALVLGRPGPAITAGLGIVVAACATVGAVVTVISASTFGWHQLRCWRAAEESVPSLFPSQPAPAPALDQLGAGPSQADS